MLCLKPQGRLVITGVTSGSRSSIDLSILQGRPAASDWQRRVAAGRSMADVMKMVNQGALHGIVGRTFPMAGVAEAHQAMHDRDFFGKLVIEH